VDNKEGTQEGIYVPSAEGRALEGPNPNGEKSFKLTCRLAE